MRKIYDRLTNEKQKPEKTILPKRKKSENLVSL